MKKNESNQEFDKMFRVLEDSKHLAAALLESDFWAAFFRSWKKIQHLSPINADRTFKLVFSTRH